MYIYIYIYIYMRDVWCIYIYALLLYLSQDFDHAYQRTALAYTVSNQLNVL